MKTIPVYSIDKFISRPLSRDFEIEVFDKNRNFKVAYPHRHDFYEILFITHGTGVHTIDFRQFEIKPFSIFFLSPGQIHSLDLSPDIKGYIFLFTSGFYLLNKSDEDKLFEMPFFYNITQENPPLYLERHEDRSSIINLFEHANGENQKNEESASEVIRSLLDIILILCKRLYPQQQTGLKMKKGKLLVKKFKQLIAQKYHENIPVKDYASQLSVSPNHLNETVKNLTGRTATDLINEKIVLEIKRMLLYTEMTVSEISNSLNFADQSYFSKYFKNRTGFSPYDFRKSMIST